MGRWLPLVLLLFFAGICCQAADPSPFGVVLAVDGDTVDQDLAAIHELGASWIRILPDWTLQAPDRTVRSWDLTDRVIHSARRDGLGIVYTLGFTPRWASTFKNESDTDAWNKNPPESHAWLAWLQELKGRYGKDVTCWQLWERPRIHFFRGSNKDVADLLRSTNRTLPGVLIAPDQGPIHLTSINSLYSYGAETYFDVLGLYPLFERPEQMLRPLETLQRDIVQKKGPLKEIWISGLGWNVEKPTGLLRDPQASEDDQARYLVRGTVLALSHGVRRIFWSALRDRTGGPYQLQTTAGLLRADGSRRAAFAAYQHLIHRLSGQPYRNAASWGPHRYGYLFGNVLVAWSDAGDASLPSVAGAEVTDIFGKPAPLTLSASPLFITAPDLQPLLDAHPQPEVPADPDYSGATEVHIGSGLTTVGPVVSAERGGVPCSTTSIAEQKTRIMLNVDPSFLYFIDGRFDVDVTVEVWGNETDLPMGFNVAYDGMKGFSFTHWQDVEKGPGWKTYTFHIRDASFSDPVSNLRINALGSKTDIFVRSVTVRKIPAEGRGGPR